MTLPLTLIGYTGHTRYDDSFNDNNGGERGNSINTYINQYEPRGNRDNRGVDSPQISNSPKTSEKVHQSVIEREGH